MKVTVLGSGGSEGIPVPFCDCKICRKAKGKDIRLRTSYWISAGPVTLLVEASLDLRQQILKFRLDRFGLGYLFLSHCHLDHVAGLIDLKYWDSLAGRHQPEKLTTLLGEELASWLMPKSSINLHPESIQAGFIGFTKKNNSKILILKPFQEVGLADKITLTFFAGPHENVDSGGFILKQGRKSLVYLGDMGLIPPEVTKTISAIEPDLVIAHSPHVCRQVVGGKVKHLGLEDLKEFPGKAILVSHFSHKAQLFHDEISKKAKQLNKRLLVAYDGMELGI